MKRKQKCIAIGAMLLLLMALCVPVISGALAEGTTEPLIVPIEKATEVFAPDGAKIGTLAPDRAGGNVLTVTDTERYSVSQVLFDYAQASKATTDPAVLGRTLVQFRQAAVGAAKENTSVADSGMPTEGWIDVTLVIKAQAARHAIDQIQIKKLGEQIVTLESGATLLTSAPTDVAVVRAEAGVFSADQIAIWVPLVALALGVIGAGALVWTAISAAAASWETKWQTKFVKCIAEALKDGISFRTPIKVEQETWPREGRVPIASESLDQLVEMVRQGAIYGGQYGAQTQQQPEEPLPPPVREGEEPELLALANRLAGVASAPEWKNIVRDAGWRAIQLQSNPTEKGTYVADDSGYSIIACLVCGAEPELAYVVPSYQDPNASEPRWSEFYMIHEDMSVKNYYVEALPVMFIERGTFFLPKSKGRLIRRPQYY